jgi:acetyl-CoA acetyltransferase
MQSRAHNPHQPESRNLSRRKPHPDRRRAAGRYPARWVAFRARMTPGAPAFTVHGKGTVSYAALDRDASRLASRLADLGVAAGARSAASAAGAADRRAAGDREAGRDGQGDGSVRSLIRGGPADSAQA